MIRTLKTADHVIDALGGTAKTSRLVERSQQSVSNWRASGRLPASTYVVMIAALSEIDCTAPSELWSIKQVNGAAHRARG